MEIILLENIENLGMRGDIVNVKDGYARNFLLPKELGAKVSPENLKRLESLRKKMRHEELERMGMLREMATRLNSVSLTIQAKVSADGHLFGSVTSSMVHDALTQEGVELDPRAIRLEENIKEVGVYTVPVHLHSEIQAKLRVWVVEERADGKAPEISTEASENSEAENKDEPQS